MIFFRGLHSHVASIANIISKKLGVSKECRECAARISMHDKPDRTSSCCYCLQRLTSQKP